MSSDLDSEAAVHDAPQETSVVPTVPRILRSRWLALAGSVFVGGATRLWFAESAFAGHGSPPAPCSVYGVCHACSGGSCTMPDCFALHTTCASGDGHCWWVCSDNHNYHCCDHYDPHNFPSQCICRGVSSVGC